MKLELINEYNRRIDSTYEYIDTSEYEEKEEAYRVEYRELMATYMGILSTIDIMFEPNEEIAINAQKAQEELQEGFGFDYDKYTEYFWEQIEEKGNFVSEDEVSVIFNEITRIINEDCTNKFFYTRDNI